MRKPAVRLLGDPRIDLEIAALVTTREVCAASNQNPP
jgi:hypothetical protein